MDVDKLYNEFCLLRVDRPALAASTAKEMGQNFRQFAWWHGPVVSRRLFRTVYSSFECILWEGVRYYESVVVGAEISSAQNL